MPEDVRHARQRASPMLLRFDFLPPFGRPAYQSLGYVGLLRIARSQLNQTVREATTVSPP